MFSRSHVLTRAWIWSNRALAAITLVGTFKIYALGWFLGIATGAPAFAPGFVLLIATLWWENLAYTWRFMQRRVGDPLYTNEGRHFVEIAFLPLYLSVALGAILWALIAALFQILWALIVALWLKVDSLTQSRPDPRHIARSNAKHETKGATPSMFSESSTTPPSRPTAKSGDDECSAL